MKISVIIPTYNRINMVEKTINSILNQTHKADEIIIIDDGSTDDTKNILFKNKNIIYKYQENKGVSSARNYGIKLAKNNWIAFCDSDDIWDKNKLYAQVEYHKNNPHILFSHTNEIWKFNDKIIKQNKKQQKPNGFCFLDNIDSCKIGASTVLIHKSIFDDIGIFDENLIACEDYDIWLRILLKYELGLLEESLITKIAGHDGQLSFTTPLMDTYRVKALLKHAQGKYKKEVRAQLLYKINLLIKGAKKHKNQIILDEYTNILDTF